MSCTIERPRTGTGSAREESQGCEHRTVRSASSRGRSEPSVERPPEARAAEGSEEPIALAEALKSLVAILPRLADALERQSEDRPRVERLTYRIEDLADALGVSRRFFERARASGRLPKPDLRIGKVPLWRVETIRNWLDKGGRV